MNEIEEIRKFMASETKEITKAGAYIPSGLTLFDLACTDDVEGAFKLGTFINFIGDSHTGKSILALTVLTMVANIEKYDHYNLIYDDVENANSFNMEYLFGKKAAERIKAPDYDDNGYPIFSDTVEQFTYNYERILDKQGPTIYVFDSLDAISTIAEQERHKEHQKKINKGEESDVLSSTYGTEKARLMSQFFQKQHHTNRRN
jgi:ABC-type dipeptide/oligopeptide/nickel transport system ATPase component